TVFSQKWDVLEAVHQALAWNEAGAQGPAARGERPPAEARSREQGPNQEAQAPRSHSTCRTASSVSGTWGTWLSGLSRTKSAAARGFAPQRRSRLRACGGELHLGTARPLRYSPPPRVGISSPEP